MKTKHKTFVDLYLSGEILPLISQIEHRFNDFIDQWHQEPADAPELHEFLGLTHEQYANWLEGKKSIVEILVEIEHQRRHELMPWTPPFSYDVTSVFDSRGHKVCDMRGWGFLTGTGGGLGLDEETAMKIQDLMGERIAALLNRDIPSRKGK